jgi:hypothetical protein
MAKSKNRANSKAKTKDRKMVTHTLGQYANAGGRITVVRTKSPTVLSTDGGVRVCNTELLLGTSISLNTGFTKGLVTLNPASQGVPTPFPWLRNIAASYSKYRFRKLIISWVPYVGTTVNGFVQIASVYDAEDALNLVTTPGEQPISSQPEYAVGPLYAGNSIRTTDEGGVSSSNWLGVEFNCRKMTDNFTKWFYVDPALTLTNAPGDTARLNQCVGSYVVFQYVNGTPATINGAGAFYVSYDIEFTQPTLSTAQ